MWPNSEKGGRAGRSQGGKAARAGSIANYYADTVIFARGANYFLVHDPHKVPNRRAVEVDLR